MKLLITVLIFLSSFASQAANFGQIENGSLISLHEERVHNLVASSSDIRKSIETGRSVAGSSDADRKWASEFENLMNEEGEKDYLGLALEL